MHPILLISLILNFFVIAIKAQEVNISGTVRDVETKEVLIGANISCNNEMGTSSNSYGFYSIKHTGGNVKLFCSHLGYETVIFNFELSKDTIVNIFLSPKISELSEVVITTNQSNKRLDKGLGTSTIPIATIKNTPAFLGESDLMKSLSFTPGVQHTAEGKSDLTIRGGSPDQNLILLDGIPIYNANHAFGFLSIFNTNALKNVTLYKSGYPARFGSRLSSVIEINTKDGNKEALEGTATLGLLASSINIEGPIVKDKTSFFLSARRSIVDLYLLGLQEMISDDDSENNKTNFSFYDINAKIHHKISDKTSVYAMFYRGNDKLMNETGQSDISSQDISNSVSEQDWKWGNSIGAVRLNSAIRSNMFLNTTVAYNKYQYKTVVADSYVSDGTEITSGLDYSSGVSDYSISVDCEYTPSNKHFLRSGFQLIFHEFRPEVLSLQTNENNEGILSSSPSNKIRNQEYAFYIEDEWRLSRSLKMNLGTRFSMFSTDNRLYNAIDPRFSLRYLVTDKLSLIAEYTHMEQYIHMLSNNSLLLQTDLWVPTTESVKPMRSHQFSFGVNTLITPQLTFSFSSYYKDMNHIIEYKDGASFMGTSSGWESKVESGIGRSYGIEFSLEKNFGRTTGTLSYALSKSERKFNGINYGDWFLSKYDRRHNANLLIMHKLNSKIDFTLNWTCSSGNMMSVPTMSVETPDIPYYPAVFNELTQLDSRNNYSMPLFHRLDIGMNYTRNKKKKCYGIWSFSIFNVYNRMNAFKIYVETEVSRNNTETEQPKKNNSGELVYQKKLKQISLFPIMPSISYTYKF